MQGQGLLGTWEGDLVTRIVKVEERFPFKCVCYSILDKGNRIIHPNPRSNQRHNHLIKHFNLINIQRPARKKTSEIEKNGRLVLFNFSFLGGVELKVTPWACSFQNPQPFNEKENKWVWQLGFMHITKKRRNQSWKKTHIQVK